MYSLTYLVNVYYYNNINIIKTNWHGNVSVSGVTIFMLELTGLKRLI